MFNEIKSVLLYMSIFIAPGSNQKGCCYGDNMLPTSKGQCTNGNVPYW